MNALAVFASLQELRIRRSLAVPYVARPFRPLLRARTPDHYHWTCKCADCRAVRAEQKRARYHDLRPSARRYFRSHKAA